MDDWEEERADILEFVDLVEEEDNGDHILRMPKRYIRNMENPLEFYSDEDFRERYRFRKHFISQTILPLVSENLRKMNNRGLPFLPMAQLLIALRFYATGNYQAVCGDLRGASQQSVSRIINRVSIALAEHLGEFIHFPETENEQRQNIVRFSQVAGFPGVAACVDCTHIPIANPGSNNGEVFRNRKGYFSLNVQVAAGPRMEILDIVVRHPGSSHDSVIFDRSALRLRFEEKQLEGLLLGDNGYPCRSYLLTPVIRPGNLHEIQYNTAHIRTRNIVERVFGVWKRIFPCLRRCLTTNTNTSVAVICATAVLYNLGRRHNDIVEHEDFVPEDVPIVDASNDNNQLGLLFRAQFINQHF